MRGMRLGATAPAGYREKPKLITALSLIYLLNPVANVIWSTQGRILGDPGSTLQWFGRALAAGDAMVWISVVLWASAVPLAIGLYAVRLWAWYYFIVHSVVMVAMSFVDAGLNLALSYALPLNLLFLIPVSVFLTKEIRAPYFNPRLRWWQQAERIVHFVDVSFRTRRYRSYDLSENGAFLTPREEDGGGELLSPELIGETATAVLQLNGREVELPARVVRVSSQSRGRYPAGVGIRFLPTDTDARACLRALLGELRAQRRSSRR